ncbi:Ig-like domain-containing protein, partial [Sphingobacterium lumbrici]|uniref:Ig-like domain-containing protein n=1 Tax=Sphingobacterium lumbrici TaxID=2559600 RepID=UPI001125D64D
GATGTVLWYTSDAGGTALAPETALTNGSYYASQVVDGCESVERTEVTVTITATPAPELDELAQTFCEIDAATVADLDITGATGTVLWYTSDAGGTALAPETALTNGSYYASQVVDGCESVERTEVTVTITATPAPDLDELAQTFCEIDAATVADLDITGATGTVLWYTSDAGGTALAPETALTNGSYYASQVVDGCESVERTEVTVTITATPAPTIEDAAPEFCLSDNKTLADLPVIGTGIKWYSSSAIDATVLPEATVLENGVTYYASQTANGCESLERLAVTPVVNDCSVTLSITKVANDNRVKAGESTTFTLTITNMGPGVLENGDIIKLVELPSEGLTIDAYSISSGNATIVGSGNTAEITVNQLIAVGGTIIVEVEATVSEEAPETIRNGVKVWGPDTPDTEDPDDEDETPEIPVDFPLIEAVDDFAEVQTGKDVTINVTANDIITRWPVDLSTVEIVQGPGRGRVEVLPSGEIVFYAPADNNLDPVTFTYRVKDQKGRYSNVATVTVTILPNPLIIPNVITPGNDDYNEYFFIKGLEMYDKVSLSIINRWGNEVYFNENYNNTWNGTGLNDGTYYYVLQTVRNGKKESHKGWVIIKRK